MNRSYKWPTVLAVAAAAMLTAQASPVRASAPLSYVQYVDETFPSALWTSACGTLVLRHQTGTLRIAIHEAAGHAHEIDTLADDVETIYAPSTGNSFTQAAGPVRTDYPDGIFLGAPARITFLGREYSVPGLSQQAGRQVYTAEVVYIDADGFPYTDITGIESVHGNFNDYDDYIAAGRAALGC